MPFKKHKSNDYKYSNNHSERKQSKYSHKDDRKSTNQLNHGIEIIKTEYLNSYKQNVNDPHTKFIVNQNDGDLNKLQQIENNIAKDSTETIEIIDEYNNKAEFGHMKNQNNSDGELNKKDNIPSLSMNDWNENTDKPPYSYIALIAMAILSTSNKRMTLREIYDFISKNFIYYRNNPTKKRWMNSVRHNLTMNDCFIRLPRLVDQSGSGHFWCLDPDCWQMFSDGNLRRRKQRFYRNNEEKEALRNYLSSNIPNNRTDMIEKHLSSTFNSDKVVKEDTNSQKYSPDTNEFQIMEHTKNLLYFSNNCCNTYGQNQPSNDSPVFNVNLFQSIDIMNYNPPPALFKYYTKDDFSIETNVESYSEAHLPSKSFSNNETNKKILDKNILNKDTKRNLTRNSISFSIEKILGHS